MKKIGLMLILISLSHVVLCQQYLWTTGKNDTLSNKFTDRIPLENVTTAVLEFFDQYKLYYDMSGYSKDQFVKTENYGFSDWSWLHTINDITVYALRMNPGNGSVVIVLCVSKANVNMLAFTNTPLEKNHNFMITNQTPSGRDRFARWFKTLLN